MRLPPLLASGVIVVMLGACLAEADEANETINVTATDYAYNGVPDTVPVGTELTLTNDSDDEIHEIVLVDLPGDELRQVREVATGDRSRVMELVSEHSTAVSVAPPGEDGDLIRGDLTLDDPGSYALLCVVPVGADPEEFMEALPDADGPPEVDGGEPHTAAGMYATLTVEP